MALNLFGISIPTPSLPSLPSLPKIEVPKISIPTPSLPKIEVPKISIPTPSLPKVEVPKISIPTPSLPKIEVPKISIPTPSLPKVEVPKISIPTPSLPKIEVPKVELPKVELPDLAGAAGGVSRWYDDVIKARDQSYDAGIEHIAAGDVGRGGLQFGGTMAADVLLPMDLGDAVNKWVTGRGDQIDGELALWAAIDAVSLAAAPLTFGASYAAGRALKAGKLAKAAKIAESTKVGGDMGKVSALSKLGGVLAGGGKATTKAAPKVTTSSFLKAYQQATPKVTAQASSKATSQAKQFAEYQKAQAEWAAKLRKQQQEIASQIAKQQAKLSEQMSEMAAKFKVPKVADAAADLAKAESRWAKTSSVLGKGAKTTGVLGMGLGAGVIGLSMMGGAGGPAPAPGPEEEEEELPQWLIDLLSGGAGAGGSPWIDDGAPPPELDWSSLLSMGGLDFPYGDFIYPDGLGGYTDAYGYYPAAYPDLFGLEGLGQDMCGYLEDIPGVGGVYEGAKRRGLGIPAIVGTIILIVLVVAFLRSKKGKKMVKDAKKKVSGAKKKVTG